MEKSVNSVTSISKDLVLSTRHFPAGSDQQGAFHMRELEFRVTISPSASFYSNVKLAALSLAKLGEPYASAPVVVSVGDNADVDQVKADNPWSRKYPVVWRAAQHSVAEVEPRGFVAGLDRFAEPAQANIVILIDADACLLRRIDELLQGLNTARPTVAGLMAHYSPFHHGPKHSENAWRQILDGAGLKDHPLHYGYSIATPEEAGRCPAYFNYGFVAFNRGGFESVRSVVQKYKEFARATLTGSTVYFAGQIGLALALAAAGVDILELGPEYNCPNSNEMLGRGIDDVSQIRVLHFLRKDEFDRHNFLADPIAFQLFSSAMFKVPVNQHFQRHVSSLPSAFYSKPSQELMQFD
jgi:hypothetical protein